MATPQPSASSDGAPPADDELLVLFTSIDLKRDPVRVVDGKAFTLSSGEISFRRFAAQAGLYIENGSLLLLDEPEVSASVPEATYGRANPQPHRPRPRAVRDGYRRVPRTPKLRRDYPPNWCWARHSGAPCSEPPLIGSSTRPGWCIRRAARPPPCLCRSARGAHPRQLSPASFGPTCARRSRALPPSPKTHCKSRPAACGCGGAIPEERKRPAAAQPLSLRQKQGVASTYFS